MPSCPCTRNTTSWASGSTVSRPLLKGPKGRRAKVVAKMVARDLLEGRVAANGSLQSRTGEIMEQKVTEATLPFLHPQVVAAVAEAVEAAEAMVDVEPVEAVAAMVAALTATVGEVAIVASTVGTAPTEAMEELAVEAANQGCMVAKVVAMAQLLDRTPVAKATALTKCGNS
mmetsp:Transcript_35389/g.65899  ORF Transcript_35389/g.65899 Transcript_35389/m.65899 type:complete len:172 (+) Transcript_35389:234-749(+)